MENRKKTGIIAFIILIVIAVLCFVFVNISFSRKSFLDFLNQLFLMFLYAIIPSVPAVLLRMKFGTRSLKIIANVATFLAVLCCLIHIFLPQEILDKKVVEYEDAAVIVYKYVNEWIFVVTQFVLASSVPALYCVALTGNLYRPRFIKEGREILIILSPSLMFFLSLFIRFFTVYGIFFIFEFIIDQSILLTLILSIFFVIWALLLTVISRMIYRFINRFKTNKQNKST